MNEETQLRFDCFGGTVAIHVRGEYRKEAEAAAERGRQKLLDAHRRLSRFDPESELSRLNRDSRREVPASPLLRRVVAAALAAGSQSGGLVDATLVEQIERAGYAESIEPVAPGRGALPPAAAPPTPAAAVERAPARARANGEWSSLGLDEESGTVIRPPGVRIDPGGIAKGLLADLLGEQLSGFRSFAVDCCGDIRLGGRNGRARTILVEDPFGGRPLARLTLHDCGVATSGITRRSWVGPDSRPGHQILDPASGRPAFTGLAQVTAVAPTALLAEVQAKAALLAGPEEAERWLPWGGVIVADDGRGRELEPREALHGAGAAA